MEFLKPGHMPNSQSMKSFVVDLLKNNLSPFYYYHNLEHTLYVTEKANEIAKEENCTDEEIDLLNAAALWHDTGFIHSYNNHEEESCAIAKDNLSNYGYSSSKIEIICGMIMATKLPQQPKTNLEEIIADADLEYLGTDDVAVKAELLYKEWLYLNPFLTREDWNKKQIAFLKSHHYFTKHCKKNSEPAKAAYLKKLSESEFN